jgi:hypothetical protein
MLTKPPPISWWESNSASLHQTQGASLPPAEYARQCTHQIETDDSQSVRTE